MKNIVIAWLILAVFIFVGCEPISTPPNPAGIPEGNMTPTLTKATITPLATTAEINEDSKPMPKELITMTPTTSNFSDLINLPQVKQAQEDLATRLSITTAEIEVIDIQLRTWSDRSMGCPQPGMEYPQVPQDGLFIQLQVADKTYDYHSGGTRPPFLCEQTLQSQKSTPIFGEDVLTRAAEKND